MSDIPRSEFDGIDSDRKRLGLRLAVCASELRDVGSQECEDIADGVAALAEQAWPAEEFPDEVTVGVE